MNITHIHKNNSVSCLLGYIISHSDITICPRNPKQIILMLVLTLTLVYSKTFS